MISRRRCDLGRNAVSHSSRRNAISLERLGGRNAILTCRRYRMTCLPKLRNWLATLGTSEEAQEFDSYTGGESEKKFILHYNFPNFSVGETGRISGPGRREIGHGALAERSIEPMLPLDKYPYAIRVTSEIMESNGSTSMASVCGGTLALMDAGVPMLRPVAGISVGLCSETDENDHIN